MSEPKPTELQAIEPCPICDKYMTIEIGHGKVELSCSCGNKFDTAFEYGWIDKWNQHVTSENKPTYETETDRVNALEHELGALIAKYQAVLGENVQLARALAWHDGHPGSEPPVMFDGLQTSGLKVVITRSTGYCLAHYWKSVDLWLESWTNQILDVATWWELPGGER